MKLLILGAIVLALMAVACGSDGDGQSGETQGLPTAAVQIVTASETPKAGTDTCTLSEDIRRRIQSEKGYAWADYGFNNGRGNGEGIGIIVTLSNDTQIRIPACAYEAAKALLKR